MLGLLLRLHIFFLGLAAMGTWSPSIEDITVGELAGAPWFNVKDPVYGATGGGVTDDTASIQAAVTAAAAVNGNVLIPAGTYLVTSTISWNDATVAIRGVGLGSKIVWNGNNSTPVFKGTGTPRPAVVDLWITGQPGVAGAKATAAIEIASSSGHSSYLGTFSGLEIGPGVGGTQSITFAAGILFSGASNNDGHFGITNRITFCDTGISNLQPQAIDQRWDEIRTLANGTDFDLGATTTIGVVELSGATVTNFNVSGGARVVCEKATSENSWRFLTITGSSMFSTRSGYYQASVQTTGTGGITSGLTTLVAATGTFTSAMAGRTITIAGAGPAGAALVTTIASFTSSSQVEVTDAASTTVVAPAAWTVTRIANDGFYVKGTDNATTQAVTLEDFDNTQSGSYAGPVPAIALHGNGGTSNKVLTLNRVKASTAGFTTANLDVTPRSATLETVIVVGTVYSASSWRVILNVLSGSTTTALPSFTTSPAQISDVQTFAIAPAAANPSTQGTGTWTRPSGVYNRVRCIAIAGGGGGGSGGGVASPIACTGGGGGGGAAMVVLDAPFSEFAATETIKVGGGGLGGTGVASGDGNAGAAGSQSTMTKNGVVFVTARNGGAGGAGKGSGTAAPTSSGGIGTASGGQGAASIAAGTVASAAASGQAAAGGGAGGGVTAAVPGATCAGSAGGGTSAATTGGAAGTAGAGLGGGNGGTGTDWSASDALPNVGGGGGGSESDGTHNGGNGGNGSLYGGGGGGGGACRPTGTTGSGGNGAGGIVVVFSF